MKVLIQHIRDIFFRGVSFGALRSPKWDEVRKSHLKESPTCKVCDTKGNVLNPLNVHHVRPFHLHPELELDDSNLITLCRRCHFLIGHLDNWSSWNVNVREDAEHIRNEIDLRPKNLKNE